MRWDFLQYTGIDERAGQLKLRLVLRTIYDYILADDVLELTHSDFVRQINPFKSRIYHVMRYLVKNLSLENSTRRKKRTPSLSMLKLMRMHMLTPMPMQMLVGKEEKERCNKIMKLRA
jgi:hypothetical protein